MRLLSPRLRRFYEAIDELASETEAMLPSQLDGFLAGLILSPDPIPSDEWLPLVWTGGNPEGDGAIFTDAREAEWFANLVFEHHDAILATLARGQGRYEPLLDEDVAAGEILWEAWIEGFEAAFVLRPDGWARLEDRRDEGVDAAMALLVTLLQIAFDESDLERAAIDELTAGAPASIPRLVDTLFALKAGQVPPLLTAPAGASAAKAGRNDPCPCGSGKKYKKCCGAH